MRAPAVLAAVPLLAGSAAGVLLAGPTPERFILASAAAAVFALIAGTGFLSLRSAEGVSAAVVIGCAAAGFSSGASTVRFLYAPPLLQWFHAHDGDRSEPVTLDGRLRDDAASAESGVSLVFDVTAVCASRCEEGEQAPVRGGVRLSVGGAVPLAAVARWRAGRRVRLPALLRSPAVYRNPGVADEATALARRGISLTGSVKSAALVELLAPGTAIEETAGHVRAWVRRTLAVHLRPRSERSAAIATAILIGDRTALDDEDERRLQDAGTYHVIAISGGNIAIFTALLLFAGRACRVPPRAIALLAIAVLLFYAEVAGGSASVARAVSAAVVFLAALALDHRGAPLNTVAVAALLAVTTSPPSVADAGFLLSFAATAAIILGAGLILPGGSRLRLLAALPAATLCAEVALAPVAATFFSRLTAAGLIANFAAIPLMTMVQAGSMAMLAVSPVSEAAAARIAIAVHWCADALVESARFVDVVPWLARNVHPPAWWLCAVYYAACLGLLWRRLRRISVLVLAAAIACLVIGPAFTSPSAAPAAAPGTLRVVVLDVGQGDATAVVFPDSTALLVDAGGIAGTTFDVARRVVLPALRALRIRALHALVLTHADPDHAAGAEGVLRSWPAAAVWEGVPVPPNPLLRSLSARARAQGIPWRTVRPGDIDRVGEIEIRVWHPPEPDWERQRVRNDDSVVLELRYGNVSIVLPGDIGREVEHALATRLRLAPVVILKAPHHGSASSSSDLFLDATKPRAVIFSTGRHNRFGHPAHAVVERYAARGVEMFNTANDGAVFVETDGRSVRVWGWVSRRAYSIDSH